MPKYCKECCLQGHDERNCCNIHPKLHESKIEEKEEANNKKPVGVQVDQKGEANNNIIRGKNSNK